MKEVTFQLKGRHFSGLTNGNLGKPIVVCLHGFLDNAASFVPLAPYLSDYRIIAIDLMGHGSSSHYNDGHYYQLTDYVYDLYELVKRQHWQRIILIGHSLGGIVASIFSATFPELVKSLVCIESFGPLSESEKSSALQLKASFESRLKTSSSTIRQPQSFDAVIKARQLVSDMAVEHIELIMSRNVAIKENGDIQWKTDRKLRTTSPLRLTETQAASILGAIECDTLIILGNNGYEKLQVARERRAAYFSKLTVYQRQGGHYVHMESPRAVATDILTHLANG